MVAGEREQLKSHTLRNAGELIVLGRFLAVRDRKNPDRVVHASERGNVGARLPSIKAG